MLALLSQLEGTSRTTSRETPNPEPQGLKLRTKATFFTDQTNLHLLTTHAIIHVFMKQTNPSLTKLPPSLPPSLSSQ